MPGASLVLLVPLPPTFELWAALNVEFGILLCVGNSCRCAFKSWNRKAVREHVNKQYNKLKTKRYLRQSGYSRVRGDTPLSMDPDLWIKSREFIAEMGKVMTGAATTTAMPAATSSLQVPQSQSKPVHQKKNISTSSVNQAKLGWVYVRVHVHFCVQVRPFHVHAFHIPKHIFVPP
ncbi:hypothetical protein NA56DRAFT_704049 [Hyaloscypha hepaticicola]|uniref:Uncharacterized protein n=1 Tax=Hyaloscypha hepaticicola TaxID=2082293 RepID=A0A2J6Q3F2_9HELO|nr:hypothetical protein NA56DRAFT_704049 [Hyaloscypha hepaticicola]